MRSHTEIDSIALDVHAHLAPLAPDSVARLSGIDASGTTLIIDGHPVSVEPLYHPERLIAWMERNGIARALVSAPPPFYRSHLDVETAAEWVAYLNDGLHAACAANPDRLYHLPHIPLHHPDLAVATVNQWSREQVFGFSIGVDGEHGCLLSDEVLNPLWSILNQHRCFVFLHPGKCCDGRLATFYLENLLGNPHETAVAVAHLVFAGVPDQYPGIRFGLAHGGGNTAMMAGRWQQGYATDRPGVDKTIPGPGDMLSTFYVDCIVHDANALALCRSVFGEHHVLFGSDWPFPMGLAQPHEQLGGVNPAFRRSIFQDNPDMIVSMPTGRGNYFDA